MFESCWAHQSPSGSITSTDEPILGRLVRLQQVAEPLRRCSESAVNNQIRFQRLRRPSSTCVSIFAAANRMRVKTNEGLTP
jgi:hypothetical protein